MNLEEWKTEVENHNKIVDTVLSDRRILKDHMTQYLSQFFDVGNDEIEYSTHLDVITIRPQDEISTIDNINEFPFEFEIDFCRATIKVYPWGLNDEH